MSPAVISLRRLAVAKGLPLAVLSTLVSMPACAQSLAGSHLGSWSGSLALGYQNDRERSHSSGVAADTTSAISALSEQVTIRNEGFSIVDPRLITGNVGLTFGLGHFRGVSAGVANSHSMKLDGYSLDSQVLTDRSISGGLFANRAKSFLTQPFSRSEIASEIRGAKVRMNEDSFLKNWGLRHFSSSLRVDDQHLQVVTTTLLGLGFRRDERRKSLGYEGHNGFDTADLDWRYDITDLKDLINPLGSYISRSGNLNYSVDFGARLNRRSDTQLSYSNLSGTSPITIVTGDERVHIAHYTNLSTDYRYQWMQIDTQAGKTLSQVESFQLQHELYRNLSTSVQTSASSTDLSTGKRSSYAGQLEFNYRRSLPWKGKVTLRLGGRNQHDDNRLTSSQLSVVDESHAAPTPLGTGAGFLLDQSLVSPASVTIIDARGGARALTSLGIDYELVMEGDLTRVVPLITSGRIQPGDPLLISYSYQVDASIKYDTVAKWINAGVDFRWFGFSMGHEQSDQTRLSGKEARFLQDVHKDSAQLNLRGAWRRIEGQAGISTVRYQSTRLEYTQRRFNQFVTYRPRGNMTFALTAEKALTSFTLPQRTTDSTSARLALDWYGHGGWSTTSQVSRRIYKDSSTPTEAVSEASFRSRLDYAKLSVASGVSAVSRSLGGSRTTSWRLDVTATRRF